MCKYFRFSEQANPLLCTYLASLRNAIKDYGYLTHGEKTLIKNIMMCVAYLLYQGRICTYHLPYAPTTFLIYLFGTGWLGWNTISLLSFGCYKNSLYIRTVYYIYSSNWQFIKVTMHLSKANATLCGYASRNRGSTGIYEEQVLCWYKGGGLYIMWDKSYVGTGRVQEMVISSYASSTSNTLQTQHITYFWLMFHRSWYWWRLH